MRVGYQEESNPQLSLVDLDDSLISVSRRSSFAESTCGDLSPILPSGRRDSATTAKAQARKSANKGDKRKRTADVAGLEESGRQGVAKAARVVDSTLSDMAEDKEGGDKDVAVEVKERKCVREKRRRAELNAAYNSLAKTLSLPPKCNKTALLQKAEETIKTLRKHIIALQEAKHQSYSSNAADKGMTVPVPWMLGSFAQESGVKSTTKALPAAESPGARDTQSNASTERTLVEQMKVCIDRMIKLTEMKQGKPLNDAGVTHSPCA